MILISQAAIAHEVRFLYVPLKVRAMALEHHDDVKLYVLKVCIAACWEGAARCCMYSQFPNTMVLLEK